MFCIVFRFARKYEIIHLISEPGNSCDSSWILLSLSWDLNCINYIRTWKCQCRADYFIRKTIILVSQVVLIRITYNTKLLLTLNYSYKETFRVCMGFFQVITGVSEGRLSRDTWGSTSASTKFVRNLDSLCILYCDGLWPFARQRFGIATEAEVPLLGNGSLVSSATDIKVQNLELFGVVASIRFSRSYNTEFIHGFDLFITSVSRRSRIPPP